MRLGDVTGFELRLSESINIRTDESKPQTIRLVAFSIDQASPVYISEKLEPSSNNFLKTNEVSFENSACHRSFRLALQLFLIGKESSQLLKSWDLDLRALKASQNTPKVPEITILTTMGAMVMRDLGNEESNGVNVSTIQADGGANGFSDNRVLNTLQNKLDQPENIVDSTHTQGASPNVQWPSLSSWLNWGPAKGTDEDNSRNNNSRESLSYSTLVDIWTLERILDEMRTVKVELCDQINQCLPKSALPLKEKEAELDRRKNHIRKKIKAVIAETNQVRNDTKQIIAYRTNIMRLLRASVTELEPVNVLEVTNLTEKLNLLENKTLSQLIKREQARLAADLLSIFPIEPLGDGKFHFAINGLMLPSVFSINHYDTTQIGAALGFVAQVVVCLSRYLDIVLPYPITVYGSQSYVTDNISQITHGSNKFPLWTCGVLLYRVEYALYLLHKDIEQLMNSLGLAVADLKQTLANLRNLLLVVSSNSTIS